MLALANDLFSVAYPTSWTAHESEDGSGLILAGSQPALERSCKVARRRWFSQEALQDKLDDILASYGTASGWFLRPSSSTARSLAAISSRENGLRIQATRSSSRIERPSPSRG